MRRRIMMFVLDIMGRSPSARSASRVLATGVMPNSDNEDYCGQET